MATFPDALTGVRLLLDPLGTTYLHLTVDFADDLPAHLIYRAGGSERFPFREDRITVQTYASGSTEVRRLAEKVASVLADKPHDGPDGTVLDRITVETVPVEVPQYDGQPAMATATYRVETRAL